MQPGAYNENFIPPEVPGYLPPPPGQHPQEEQPSEQRQPMTPQRRMFIIASVLIVVISIAFVLRAAVFSIRNVRVVGIQQLSWQDVARSAMLSPSSNYFNLNENKIREGINSNRYLVYERMETVFPNTLVLFVKERQPAASINYIGISYIMADDGMVLEKTKDLGKYAGLMTISGLDLRDIRTGSVPMSTRLTQMDTCIALTRELKAQGFHPQIKDINLSEPTSVYLSTTDGYSIHLGDGQQLRAKIGTVRAVLEECRRRGYSPGVIEATIPGEATYRPVTLP